MYELPDHTGRTVLITGATSGLGLEASRRFAAAGAHVILAARNTDKAENVVRLMKASQPDAEFSIRQLDLASLKSVEQFAEGVVADGLQIDTLINNAGVMAPARRFETVDGHELQFGTNFLGPYALTARLLPILLKSDRPRVAIQASMAGHVAAFRDDDPDSERHYMPWLAYSHSKLNDLLLGIRLAQLSDELGWGLRSTAAHPGFTRTPLQSTGPLMGRSPSSFMARLTGFAPGSQHVTLGVEPLLMAAGSNVAPQGAYFGPSRSFGMNGPAQVIELPRVARGPELLDRVEKLGEQFTGLSLRALGPASAQDSAHDAGSEESGL